MKQLKHKRATDMGATKSEDHHSVQCGNASPKEAETSVVTGGMPLTGRTWGTGGIPSLRRTYFWPPSSQVSSPPMHLWSSAQWERRTFRPQITSFSMRMPVLYSNRKVYRLRRTDTGSHPADVTAGNIGMESCPNHKAVGRGSFNSTELAILKIFSP